MFGGLTHEPALRLAQRLVEVTPDGLEHVFLADSGSVSVEVALKMTLQYQRGAGRPERHRMLTVRGGYHGDTFGCMSVCDPVGGMHSMFSRRAAPAGVRRPPAGRPDADVPAWAESFERLADEHAHELAGIIVEPLLQGAGGMHVYPAECLRVMREVADRHGLVLVFDEIATGFGRTGTFFAADAAGRHARRHVRRQGADRPATSAQAAVLCTAEVAHGLSRVRVRACSCTGRRTWATRSPARPRSPTSTCSPPATGSGDVARINDGLARGPGPAPRPARRGRRPHASAPSASSSSTGRSTSRPRPTPRSTHGVWLRPFRDLVYTMPPYVCTDDDIAADLRGDPARR